MDYSILERYKLGIIQFNPKAGEVASNIDDAKKLIEESAKLGAKIVLLPELWAIGYGIANPQKYSEHIGGPITGFMCKQAKKYKIYIAGGYPEKDDTDKCYDSAILINPQGEAILNHRKVHLYSSLGEDKVWTPGDSFNVVQTELGRIGIMICFDGDFCESWRSLACQGVDIVLHPTAYESPCENYGWWKKLYEANSLANAVWSVSANIVGDTPNKESHFFGWSRIIDPFGEELATASYVKPDEDCQSEVLVVEIPFSDSLSKGRERNGCFLKYRRPDIYYPYVQKK